MATCSATFRMTRCECHEVEFEEVARNAEKTGIWTLKFATRHSGCGQTCTACHCDLKAFLAERRASAESRPDNATAASGPAK